MIAGPPIGAVTVPRSVRKKAKGRRLRPVWVNGLGGITFEMESSEDRFFIKWAPAGSGLDLSAEAVRLTWAATFTPVPGVLEHGSDDDGAWLVTTALPGSTAVSERWRNEPVTAVRAIGEGLRAFHESLPVASCPFSWSASERLADASRRASMGQLDPANWHEVHRTLKVEQALAVAQDVPAVDQLVVCQGDACAPNTLLTDDGCWSGHVDLGCLGVADRWADLAIATWSTEWNYGPDLEPQLLAAYGVKPDAERTRYYRLLWDLGP